jgi:hypothetical protein
VLLHFCQLIELGLKELGRARANGGVMYLGKVSFSFSPSRVKTHTVSLSRKDNLSFIQRNTHSLAQRPPP